MKVRIPWPCCANATLVAFLRYRMLSSNDWWRQECWNQEAYFETDQMYLQWIAFLFHHHLILLWLQQLTGKVVTGWPSCTIQSTNWKSDALVYTSNPLLWFGWRARVSAAIKSCILSNAVCMLGVQGIGARFFNPEWSVKGLSMWPWLFHVSR